MRILLLSDIDTPHTIKWAIGLAGAVDQVGIFGLMATTNPVYQHTKNITLFSYGLPKSLAKSGEGRFQKWRYLKAIRALKKIIATFQPDIVHAHYATSYGLLGRLSGFQPLVISVWGRDIFNFPRRSFAHRLLVQWILSGAKQIASTSQMMAKETGKYTDLPITVIPFGIDIYVFKPKKVISPFGENVVVIGSIKSLEPKYGLDDLIRAFAVLKAQNDSLRLLLVGEGAQHVELQQLARDLGVSDAVVLTGAVPYQDIVDYHNMLDIAVFPSIEDSESFGVSILEASACGKPVVASNVGGLPEVVIDQQTGLLVPPKHVEALVMAIQQFIDHPQMRKAFGLRGQQFVGSRYAWQACLQQQLGMYSALK